MKKYTAAVFDLDGTIFDSSEGIIASLAHVFRACGCQPPPPEELFKFIGPPLYDSFMKTMGVTKERSRELTLAFREHYSAGAIYLAKPYEGIFQLFDALKEKGLKLAVATYKPQPQVDLLARRFQLFRWMDAVCGADDAAGTKALIIEKALKQCGSLPGEAVMVGDTRQDRVGALEAGTDFIGVSYGFGFTPKEADDFSRDPEGAEFPIVKNPLDVLKYI